MLLKKVEPLMGGIVGERDQRGLGCGEKIEWEKSMRGVSGLRVCSKCKIHTRF